MKMKVSHVSRIRSMLILGMVAASLAPIGQAVALNYTAHVLTPDLPLSSANTLAGLTTGGYSAAANSFGVIHATLWEGATSVDLHPDFVGGSTSGGSSAVQGSAEGLQVGWAYGPGTGNRYEPLSWNNSAASATPLPIPFAHAGGKALATDGIQIVGYATTLIKDGTAIGPSSALVWDVRTGNAVDLGNGRNGAQALGVGGGQQVGYVTEKLQTAALWKGSANSLVNLHPGTAAVSIAYGTDGVTQVGYTGYDIRVRVEAVKGKKNKRFNYATLWSGTAASAVNIHPYPFTHSYATAVKGPWIVGYASDESRISTPGFNHAVIWDASYLATDLQAFLPADFVGSQALAVDEFGNVAGVALTADGQRRAVVWVRDGDQ